MLNIVMNMVSALLSVYMILVIIRIFLTWFRSRGQSKAVQILISLVDPYLAVFRKISWLQVGSMDFSPMVGVILLGLFVQITSNIAQTGSFTALMLLTYLLYSLWSLCSFILDMLIIMMLVRFISTFISKKSYQIWYTIDNILNRVMAKILGIFTSKTVSFRKALIICAVLLIILRMAMRFVLNNLLAFLNTL